MTLFNITPLKEDITKEELINGINTSDLKISNLNDNTNWEISDNLKLEYQGRSMEIKNIFIFYLFDINENDFVSRSSLNSIIKYNPSTILPQDLFENYSIIFGIEELNIYESSIENFRSGNNYKNKTDNNLLSSDIIELKLSSNNGDIYLILPNYKKTETKFNINDVIEGKEELYLSLNLKYFISMMKEEIIVKYIEYSCISFLVNDKYYFTFLLDEFDYKDDKIKINLGNILKYNINIFEEESLIKDNFDKSKEAIIQMNENEIINIFINNCDIKDFDKIFTLDKLDKKKLFLEK